MSELHDRILEEISRATDDLYDPKSLYSRRMRAFRRIADCDADLTLLDDMRRAQREHAGYGGASITVVNIAQRVINTLEQRYPVDEVEDPSEGHRVQVFYTNEDDGIWIECSCDWRCGLGFDVDLGRIQQAWEEHLENVPSDA